MVQVIVQSGDVTKVKSDALITTVNSGGLWFGAIDDAIRRTAGNLPHDTLMHTATLRDGNTFITPTPKGCAFDNVIFIVDDLHKDLHDLIGRALETAELARLVHVTIPTVRNGVMNGIKEKSISEYVSQFKKGINDWYQCYDEQEDTSLCSITIVVYNDPELQDLLEKELVKCG